MFEGGGLPTNPETETMVRVIHSTVQTPVPVSRKPTPKTPPIHCLSLSSPSEGCFVCPL